MFFFLYVTIYTVFYFGLGLCFGVVGSLFKIERFSLRIQGLATKEELAGNGYHFFFGTLQPINLACLRKKSSVIPAIKSLTFSSELYFCKYWGLISAIRSTSLHWSRREPSRQPR